MIRGSVFSRLIIAAGLLLSFAATIAAQAPAELEQGKLLGEIEFFGYGDLDVAQLRAKLPVKEGEPFNIDALSGMAEALKKELGHSPTNTDGAVCCDDHGGWMIYLGLAVSSRDFSLNPAPKGNEKFPPEILTLFQRCQDAFVAAVMARRTGEDRSKGYSLLSDPTVRAFQLEYRKYAIHHESLIQQVLRSASDLQQRAIAAQLLGYARQSRSQILGLVAASRDPDETVRNNATRALAVLAMGHAKVAALIPATPFIEMLWSGTWSDLNKGSWLLDNLTQTREPKLLAQLHAQAMRPLTEMALWRSQGHAAAARSILGRMAGIPEARLNQLVQAGQAGPIFDALRERGLTQ